MSNPRVGVAVPTLNAGARWPDWLAALHGQSLPLQRVVVLDSMSDDATVTLALQAGYEVVPIRRVDFDHGTTRQIAVDLMTDCEVVVFLTQDALLATPESLHSLVAAFATSSVAVAWGRQLPHHNATPIAAHARAFNYPSQSRTVSLADVPRLGIKTAFCSNSFSAWRREALCSVGGFPGNALFGEDTLACGQLLLAGWQAAYVAEAPVYHSHNYSLLEELRRSFDIGAMHALTPWFLQAFGSANGEGKRFVISELKYLLRNAPLWCLRGIAGTLTKYSGYQLGRRHALLPLSLKCWLGMHGGWWLRHRDQEK